MATNASVKAAVAAQLALVQAAAEDGTATINDAVVDHAAAIKEEITSQAGILTSAISEKLVELQEFAIDEMEIGYTSPLGRGVASNAFRRAVEAAFASAITILSGSVTSADAAIDAVVDGAVLDVDGLVTTADGSVGTACTAADAAIGDEVDIALPE